MSIGKKIAIGGVAFVSAIAILLSIEHFRGKWGLQRWRAGMVAKGEAFDSDKLTPILPPPAQNGMPALVWAAAQFSGIPSEVQPPLLTYTAPGKAIPIVKVEDWRSGARSKSTNVNWTIFGEELNTRKDAVKGILAALQAEEFQASLNFRMGFSLPLPHLARLKQTAQSLAGAVVYDVHRGNLDEAMAKFRALLRMPDVLEREPLVISQMVRIAIGHIAFDTTWQALQAEGWSDAQLAELQKAWTEHDFLRPMESALTMERSMTDLETERLRNSDTTVTAALDGIFLGTPGASAATTFSMDWLAEAIGKTPQHVYSRVWKFAWSYQDQWRYGRKIQSILDLHRAGVKKNNAAELIAALRDKPERDGFFFQREPDDEQRSYYDRLRFVLSPLADSLFPGIRRAWIMETTKHLAIAGIALRRYELRHGKLPDKLEALVPEFLPEVPIDLMDGTSLKYRLFSNGFILYSVGWNGKDDGGDVTPLDGKNLNYQTTKDLVWPHPASKEETDSYWKNQ